jgi:hypothetical protein
MVINVHYEIRPVWTDGEFIPVNSRVHNVSDRAEAEVKVIEHVTQKGFEVRIP